MSLPTKERIEEYLRTLEDYVSSSLSAVTPDLLAISDTLHRLWLDLSRFGPPEISIPGLGNFQVPPPPPPPPPPPSISWVSEAGRWASDNRLLLGGICIGAVGAGLLAGYGVAIFTRRSSKGRGVKTSSVSLRRQVIIVLGGDTPLGLPLISALELEGFIIITSVSTHEAVDELERKCNGYVRALVFDPKDPATMSYFLRSLQATMSLRFPINVPGDPYHASPATGTYIHSLISLLTLPSPSISPMPTPIECLPLTSTYMPYLTQTHISPLQAIQGILPLFRVSHARARDASSRDGGRRSVVICVPATDARVGMPFTSAQAMSATATVRGAEVLRREIRAASMSGAGYEAMKDLKVVVVDVGAIGSPSTILERHPSENIVKSMVNWTPSERSVYGDAFSNTLEHIQGLAPRRKPSGVNVFIDALVTTVGGNGMRGRPADAFSLEIRRWGTKLRNWIRGERFAVGAGAHTYTFASYLPTTLLDALLSLPALLVSMRNAILPMPVRSPAPHIPPPITTAVGDGGSDRALSSERAKADVSSSRLSEAEQERKGMNSYVDVKSNAGEGLSVDGSWVSLQKTQ